MTTYIHKVIKDGRVVYLFRSYSNWIFHRTLLADALDNPSVEWDIYRDEDDIEAVRRIIEDTSARLFKWVDHTISPNLHLDVWWNDHLGTYRGTATIDHTSFHLKPSGFLVREYRRTPVFKMGTIIDVLRALDNLHLK